MLPIRLFIDAVIRTANEEGIAVYVVHSGDAQRGDIFVKTQKDNNRDNKSDKINHKDFCIHHRTYDFMCDTYVWQTTAYTDETSADDALHQYHQQDTDCWCIEIAGSKNYFADIL